MLRVHATIAHSEFANTFKGEQRDLIKWVSEIQDAMYLLLDGSSSLFHNYATDTSSFLDGASSALLAASVYRIALLGGVYHNLPNAEKTRKAISGGNHFDGDGWLTPVVNPNNVGNQGEKSPEAQAFVLMMQAAYNDWKTDGSKGVNSASSRHSGAPQRTSCFFACMVLGLFWLL